MGAVTVEIPQVRGMSFYPRSLEKGCRSDLSGKRELLGVSVSLSKAETHWRSFLQSLKERGLHGVDLFTSDDHAGLKLAGKRYLPECRGSVVSSILHRTLRVMFQSGALTSPGYFPIANYCLDWRRRYWLKFMELRQKRWVNRNG